MLRNYYAEDGVTVLQARYALKVSSNQVERARALTQRVDPKEREEDEERIRRRRKESAAKRDRFTLRRA